MLEYKLEVIKLVEESIPENVIVEDIQVEIILSDDIEEYVDSYLSSDIAMYDINWGQVIGKFAIGTGVIIVTAVLSAVTAEVPGVGIVFATSCKEALKEGLIGAAIGAATGTLIGALQSGGKVTAMQKYAIEGAADGFMWGTITGALMGAYKGYANYKSPNVVTKGNKKVGNVNGLDIVDDAGKVTGKITPNGYAVSLSGEIIGKLDDAGNVISGVKSLIPASGKIVGSTGRVKYAVNATNQVIDKAGKIVGSINDAGQIYTSSGTLLGMVDDTGQLMSGLQKTINAGFKVDLSGKIINNTKKIGDVIYYIDDADNIIGSIMQVTNSAGKSVSYVTKTVAPNTVKVIGDVPEEGLRKIVGQIDDAGNLVTDWNKFFQVERSKGVSAAWAQEKALVEATGRGTYNWTAEEMVELLTKGKVKGYQGHHINSALYSPQLAADPNNIIFYNAVEHLSIGHAGNFQNVTFGSLLSRL